MGLVPLLKEKYLVGFFNDMLGSAETHPGARSVTREFEDSALAIRADCTATPPRLP